MKRLDYKTKNFSIIITFLLLLVMAVCSVFSGSVFALQPTPQSDTGTYSTKSAGLYRTAGFSLMFNGITTSISRDGDPALLYFNNDTSQKYSSGFTTITLAGNERRARASAYVYTTSGWRWNNYEILINPANFNKNDLVVGRSLLDNLYLEVKGDVAKTKSLDDALAKGGTAWISEIVSGRTLSLSHSTMATGKLWNNGSSNYTNPDRTYSTSNIVDSFIWSSTNRNLLISFYDHQFTFPSIPEVDTTPPTGTISINDGDTYTKSVNINLTISATDSGSGVSQMMISNDPGFATNTGWIPYATSKPWTLTSGDGNKIVYIKFKDNAGNVSGVYNDSIILDTTPPTGSISINSGATYTSSVNVNLTISATDISSGVGQMMISNDPGFATNTGWIPYATSKPWTLISGVGTKTVYISFKDNAGNVSSVYNDSIILNTGPTVLRTDPVNNANGVPLNKTITVTFSENVLASTAYNNITVKDIAGNSVIVSKSISGAVLTMTHAVNFSPNTKYTVTIPAAAVKDIAGNNLVSPRTFSFTTAINPANTIGQVHHYRDIQGVIVNGPNPGSFVYGPYTLSQQSLANSYNKLVNEDFFKYRFEFEVLDKASINSVTLTFNLTGPRVNQLTTKLNSAVVLRYVPISGTLPNVNWNLDTDSNTIIIPQSLLCNGKVIVEYTGRIGIDTEDPSHIYTMTNSTNMLVTPVTGSPATITTSIPNRILDIQTFISTARIKSI